MRDNTFSMEGFYTDEGQLKGSIIDSSQIDISNFQGSIPSTIIPMSDIVNSQDMNEKIENALSNTVKTSDIDLNKWKTLSSSIEIISEETPQINIASLNSDGTVNKQSYLSLMGDQINFIVDNQGDILTITKDGVKAYKIRTNQLDMSYGLDEPTLGWILRANGHLSLKVLKEES